MGINVIWDCEHAKTPDGYYQVRGGIDYAIAKSLAVAPYADVLWMETKTADLHDAKKFADAIHAEFPDKMLAYNLSPSFNWDTTGMTDEEMRRFPEELGKMGFVFNFITYGGHQIDGLAGEEFATALRQDGMLALARLQRKFRLLESPYRTPQTLVGGPRADAGADGDLGPHLDDEGDGQGLDAVPAPRCRPRCRRSCSKEWLELWRKHHGDRRQAQGLAAAAHRGLRAARARHLDTGRGEGRRTSSSSRHPGSPRAQASSRCATRTRSTPRFAASGS